MTDRDSGWWGEHGDADWFASSGGSGLIPSFGDDSEGRAESYAGSARARDGLVQEMRRLADCLADAHEAKVAISNFGSAEDAARRSELRALMRRQQRGIDAREEFIDAHGPAIDRIASEFAGRGIPLDDLLQEGRLCLSVILEGVACDPSSAIEALGDDSVEKSVRLAMARLVEEQAGDAGITKRLVDLVGSVVQTRMQLRAQLGTEPDAQSVAQAASLDLNEVKEVEGIIANLIESTEGEPDEADQETEEEDSMQEDDEDTDLPDDLWE